MFISLTDGSITYSERVTIAPCMPGERVNALRALHAGAPHQAFQALAVFSPDPEGAGGLLMYVDFPEGFVTRATVYVPHKHGAPMSKHAQIRYLSDCLGEAFLNACESRTPEGAFGWGDVSFSWDADNAALKMEIAYRSTNA